MIMIDEAEACDVMRYGKVLLRYLHWKVCCMLVLISAQVCGYARSVACVQIL